MTADRILFHARNVLAIVGLVGLCGCASIVDGRSARTIRIDSNPPGATVTIYDKENWKVDSNTTPFAAQLRRSSGYFSGERYRLVFDLPGYHQAEVSIKSTINGWYFGNIVFGGAIGLLIVDPATGAMWNLSPRKLTQELDPIPAAVQTGSDTNNAAPAGTNQPAAPVASALPPPVPAEPPATQPAPGEKPSEPPTAPSQPTTP